MQFISLGVVAAGAAGAPDFRLVIERLGAFGLRDEVRAMLNAALLVLALIQIITVCVYWFTAKLLVGDERASIGNAVRLWLYYLLSGLLLFAAIVGALVFAAATDTFLFLAVLVGGFALYLIWLLILPMKVYGISILRSLPFVAFTILLNYGVRTAVGTSFDFPDRAAALEKIKGADAAERLHFSQRLLGHDSPDEIDRLLDNALLPIGKPGALSEREAAARIIQQKLEARRRTIPPGDPPALAEFQPRLDRYLRLLAKLKAERATQPPPAAGAAK